MSNNNYNFYPRLDGLNNIEADSISTNALTTSNLQVSGPLQTNLIQSTALGQNITIESQGASKVIIKANGSNVMEIDNSNALGLGPIINFVARLYCYQQNTNGGANLSIGLNSLRQSSITVSFNVAIGVDTLRSCVSSPANTGIGWQCLFNLASGAGGNMACGYRSGRALTTGSQCMFLAAEAGSQFTTSSNVICIGANSGVATAYGTTNSGSIFIGTNSGNGSIGGINNTAIGFQSNDTLNAAAYSNSTCIGYKSQISSSNQIQLGRSTEYVSAQKMSLGKTSVPANTLDVVGGVEINNGGLIFSKSTNSTQTIQWTDQLGQALGLLYASTISSAFVFDVATDTAVNGYQVRTMGQSKLRIDATNTDFTLNPVNLKTGIALSVYNEDDTNNTSIVSLGTATTYNNFSASGNHDFQINNGLVFSVNSSNIDAYKSIVIRGGNAFQVSNTAGTNYINFSSLGTSCYINNFDATGSNITQIGGVEKFTIGPSSVASANYMTAPTEVAGSNNTRLATTAFVQTAVAGVGAGYATLAGTNAWTGTNTFNTNLPTSTITATTNSQLTNLSTVKNEAQSQIDNINFYNTEIKRIDDFDNDIGTLNGGQTETSVFRWTNAGNYGFTQVNGIANHQGLIEGFMNPTLGTHTFQLQLAQLPVTFDNIATCEWIFRLDTNNTFQDITLGISNSSNTFANCFAWRYTGTSFFVYINQAGGFYTCVNNTGNLYNKWIYIKIFITKLVVYFTLTDIATGTTDTYNYNSGGLMNLGIACGPAFAALQNTNGSTKITIDYCSYSYVCNRK